MDSRLLSPDDIVGMIPRDLILRVVKDFKLETGLSVAVMLDKDLDEFESSWGTGKVYITDPSVPCPYCRMLRASPDEIIKKRCGVCDRHHFEDAKRKVAADPSYNGEVYWCTSGGLLDFVVPIVEKESTTFIGAILGGQKRPKESLINSLARCKRFLNEKENHCLSSIPPWRLSTRWLQVERASDGELESARMACVEIAQELSRPFRLLIEREMAKRDEERRQLSLDSIDQIMSNADTVDHLNLALGNIIAQLNAFVPFDWGIALVRRQDSQDGEFFDVMGTSGRGLEPGLGPRSTHYYLPADARISVREPVHNPGFLRDFTTLIVRGKPDCFWIPLNVTAGSTIGGLLVGSAPQHRKSNYDADRIQQELIQLKGVARKLAIKYGELMALEKAKRVTLDLQGSQAELWNAVKTREETLLGLTHQIRRPLFFIRAALSNLRDCYRREQDQNLIEQVELGMLMTEHAALLNRGITRIFPVAMGRKFTYSPQPIDAKASLQELAWAMHRLSGRNDVAFKFFQRSPIITMDLDSFLYVFYVLIDNALTEF